MTKKARKRVFARLQALAKKWGGELQLLSRKDWLKKQDRFPKHFHSSCAVDWEGKRVFAWRKHAHVGAVIHDMGHVFACPRGVTRSNEFAWLGWEIAMARYVGCYRSWDAQNSTYGIYEYFGGVYVDDWGDAADAGAVTKRLLIADRLQAARVYALVDKRGRPCAIR